MIAGTRTRGCTRPRVRVHRKVLNIELLRELRYRIGDAMGQVGVLSRPETPAIIRHRYPDGVMSVGRGPRND